MISENLTGVYFRSQKCVFNIDGFSSNIWSSPSKHVNRNFPNITYLFTWLLSKKEMKSRYFSSNCYQISRKNKQLLGVVVEYPYLWTLYCQKYKKDATNVYNLLWVIFHSIFLVQKCLDSSLYHHR